MLMDFTRISVELVIGFFSLFIITQLLGKTQITQITPFDFISALVLGELVGNALYDNEIGVEKIIYSLALWGLLIYLLERITQKWRKTRGFLEGRPSIVIHKSVINKKELKKAKLDIDQLRHLLRSKGVFSLREIEYALLETDGTVSVMKKHPYDAPTNQESNIPPQNVTLPVPIISDGEILTENLDEYNLSEQWLLNELKKTGHRTPKNIIYAEWEEGKPIFFMPFSEEDRKINLSK
ncbi:DUF421 domain-containing protein [Sutcliffiella rhizosphaerae]|uniref:DUF421 domain-containing protein n=1 Tax=Sutcliffiella rhizosphaerae TaxID=2880967 RepID=A0ABN8A759_9BACI|nr:DUF421 domain-containing protein [Sutcliffiella rhizosphaerae]CAG9620479.1 hypothetical protein BACCIP111883_01247 [Sutcliffiella rhizosphaerae]